MRLSKNAKDLLSRRYCREDEQPKDVFKRVSSALSLGDEKFSKQLLKLMNNGIFLPNSPCLRNAGTKKGLLHACFVLPVKDNMESLSDSLKHMMIIFKHGGGVGLNFSELRPKDAMLSTGGSSSGVVSFMKLYDVATETVKQGGFRRGALMGILNFEHDEIIRFISSKLTGDLTNFNISVMVSDKFMQDIVDDNQIELKNPQNDTTTGTIGAKTIFDVIAHAAWYNGDPGLLFYDAINRDNKLFPKVKIKATNPCITGDTLILTPYGEKTVEDFIKNIKNSKEIICEDGKVREIDNIETNFNVPTWEIELENNIKIKATLAHQFYGWKEMSEWEYKGWMTLENILSDADIRIKLFDNSFTKIKKTRSIGEQTVYDFHEPVTDTWITNGIISRGCGEVPLPDYGACCLGSINLSNLVKYNKFDFSEFEKVLKMSVRALRNMNAISWYPLPEITKVMKELDPIGVGIMGFADCLIKLGIYYDSQECLDFIDELGKVYKKVTDKLAKDCFWKRIIAPTGSLSLIADCSSGIEPVFAIDFERHLTVGVMKEKRELYKSTYTRVAHDIEPIWHLKVQAQWQKWVDGSISKTINLPYEASIEDVKNIYMKAWEMGCKGITIFRDGSKEGVLKKVIKQKCSDESCTL